MSACTYEMFSETDDIQTSSYCGRKVVMAFRRDDITYPRCTRHSTDSTVDWARDHGYDIISSPTDGFLEVLKERP